MAKTNQTDVLKGLAIIAVVTIHVTSAYLFVYEKLGTGFWQIKIIVDQVSRFAVPLFVALSGFALAKKYATKITIVDFYLHQSRKLLPWYLVASVVLYLVYHWQPFTWQQIIFFGKGDYHLYFVPMVFQLYLLFPIINWICRKRSTLILLSALVFEVFFYYFIATKTELSFNNNGIFPDQKQYLFFGSWIFYFILGIFLAHKKVSQKLATVLVVFGLTWTFVSAFNLLGQGMDLIVATRFTRIPVLVYATGVIIYLFNINWNSKIFLTLGKHSFQIYLWHTAILRLMPLAILPYPLAIVLTLATTYLLAKVISYVA